VELIRTKKELAALDELRTAGPIVLVPTMGALHAGHLSLVEIAAGRGTPVVSIFVNPAQFGPGEDLEAYPRVLEKDLDMLGPLGVAAVFAPSAAEMYCSSDVVRVTPGRRADFLCGVGRPGHFSGVLTVVAKLFNLVRPDFAVFGRKDAQQFLVIAEMVRDLDFPVSLIDAPLVRDPDGLAMSSRNRYLDAADRERGLCLSRSLAAARDRIAAGERSAEVIEAELIRGLAPTDCVDYAECRRVPDLERASDLRGLILMAVAANVGPARLIDNLVLWIDDDAVVDSSLLGKENA